MAQITEETGKEIREIVYNFFAEECEKDVADLNDDINIIEDLDGDSLMFLELLEIIKRRYNINVQLQTIGKYMLQNPAETIGKVIGLSELVVEHENNITQLGKTVN